jgi:hypothetical protein
MPEHSFGICPLVLPLGIFGSPITGLFKPDSVLGIPTWWQLPALMGKLPFILSKVNVWLQVLMMTLLLSHYLLE